MNLQEWSKLNLLAITCAITGLTLSITNIDGYLGLAVSAFGMYAAWLAWKEIKR